MALDVRASAVLALAVGLAPAARAAAQAGAVCAGSGGRGSCPSADSVLLQASASHWRRRPAAWAAGPYGSCAKSCGRATRARTVECRSFFEDSVLPPSACAGQPRPAASQSCGCDVNPCREEACDAGPVGATPAPVPPAAGGGGGLASAGFAALGCLAEAEAEGGRGSPPEGLHESDIYDMACLSWSSSTPCSGGLPFFHADLGPSQAGRCQRFCLARGLDVAGLSAAGACRCGASPLNRAVWHEGKPRLGLLFTNKSLAEPNTGAADAACNTVVYRYVGHYEVGGIPFELTDTKIQDVAYIDSLVVGHTVWEEVEEDGRPGGRGRRLGRLGGPRLAAREDVGRGAAPPKARDGPRAEERPGWARHCWPGNCGPGGGPWLERGSAAEGGWRDLAVVRYWFDDAVDAGRREAFRAAADHWRSVTCINLIEEATQPWGPFVMVVVDDQDSCYAWSIGYPGDYSYTIVNVGWCSSLRYVGNIIHEIGHVLGMNHEQKRPDAVLMNRGHGPHLLMHWENVPEDWAMQYQQDPGSYMGSGTDGPSDPHAGYAPYDFDSIMQYPSNGRFETLPSDAIALTGQRHRLSDLDIAQVLDMYQCRAETAHASAS